MRSVTPPLASALAALTGARFAVDANGDDPAARFATAVVRLDEADRAYRAAIEAILPARTARQVLEAMATFRAGVAALRERTREATGYGDFDPLDTYVPSIEASHAQAVRAANLADIARGDVTRLRSQANARIATLLDRADIDRLTEAKRARNAAFDRAIRAAMPPGASDQLATQLMLLADGWY